MDALLTPVSTKYLRAERDDEQVSSEMRLAEKAESHPKAPSTDDALEILRNQPGYDALIATLQHLTAQLRVPTPQSASIVHVLVADITPNYWTLLRQGSGDDAACQAPSTPYHAELLLSCLRSVSGLNAIVAHVKALIQDSRPGRHEAKRPGTAANLNIFLDVLDTLLAGDVSIRSLWTFSATKLPNAAMSRAQSQQLAALLANGRILSTAAEASTVEGTTSSWTADGAEYSKWIGRNFSTWAKAHMAEDEMAFCFEVFLRSMSLGYSGNARLSALP